MQTLHCSGDMQNSPFSEVGMGICSTDSPQRNKHRSWCSHENVTKMRRQSQIHSGSWGTFHHRSRSQYLLQLTISVLQVCCPCLYVACHGGTANGWNDKVGVCWLPFSSEHYGRCEQPTSPAPPIASYANFYITLTAELADDISLHHTVLTNSILHHVH